VSDLADAHVAALDWLAAGKPSDSFNLGDGHGFSVAEVVKQAKKNGTIGTHRHGRSASA